MKDYIKTDKYRNKYYYVKNKLHREGGPACEYANGTKKWYKNGALHRETGPAIEWYDGFVSWYLNGKLYGYNTEFTKESWQKFVKTIIFS